MNARAALWLLAGCLPLAPAAAQDAGEATAPDGWQPCRAMTDERARLACFDRWAQSQAAPRAAPAAVRSAEPAAEPPTPALTAPTASAEPDCRSGPQSALSRFWELESGSDCGRFNIRGYRPISLSVIASDSVNTAPSSSSPNHTAGYTPYLQTEGRIQLSVRTKIAQGLFPAGDPARRDSLWFGYTQQSYWQIFSDAISRPFRNTDHEPELIYILPVDAELPGGWRLRYGGLSLNHQSNGQSLPLSRSWNRMILMAGAEKDTRFVLNARLWQRMPETADNDDNPAIEDYVGRAEVGGVWNLDRKNTLGLTVRHSLNHAANGSVRIEWLRALGDGQRGSYASGLRFHVQLFSGYGDSLVDYNRWRTVLGIGLSLVDW